MPETAPAPDRQLLARQIAQERHFIRRLRERFKIRLTTVEYQETIARIENNAPGTKFIRHQPPDRTVWLVRIGRKRVRVIYDHKTSRLVTVLFGPEDRQLRRMRHRGQIHPQKLLRLRREGKSCR